MAGVNGDREENKQGIDTIEKNSYVTYDICGKKFRIHDAVAELCFYVVVQKMHQTGRSQWP
jgi:hypothetical protein